MPIPYPNILGMSFGGTIESIGSDVSNLQKGDKVAVFRSAAGAGDLRYGAYQQYALATASFVAKLPSSVPIEKGAAVITNLPVAVSALSVYLGLDRPTLTSNATPKNKKVLIYGGSSSVGGFAVNYANAAGYDVVTTSSPSNNAFVQSLKPAKIIDHTQAQPTVVSALKENGPYEAIFDPISLPASTAIISEYLSSVGGGKYYTTLPHMSDAPIPSNVERIFQDYTSAFEEEANADLKQFVFSEWIPKGLESGAVVPTRLRFVEGGLASAQSALDSLIGGKVSGAKLALRPWDG
jgi:NADPH:quinone reductase-like Zn-dependent oxidoreductase